MANTIPVRITSRKRATSYSIRRGRHNRQLVSIPTHTKSTFSFPIFVLSNVRSMTNKLDEIQGVISINTFDVLVLTESWLTSKVSDDLIAMPGYVHVRKDRPDAQRGGGICTYVNVLLTFSIYKTLMIHVLKPNGFCSNPIASLEELTRSLWLRFIILLAMTIIL